MFVRSTGRVRVCPLRLGVCPTSSLGPPPIVPPGMAQKLAASRRSIGFGKRKTGRVPRDAKPKPIMITPTLQSLCLADGPSDESLMRSIADKSHRGMASLYRRHAKTLRKVIYQVCKTKRRRKTSSRKAFCKSGAKRRATPPPWASRWAGWSRSRAGARSIGCDGARPTAGRRSASRPISQASPGRGCKVVRRRITPRRTFVTYLEKEMKRFPAYQREALALSFFNGLSHREIARRTRTPLGTVKTRLELGLRKLSTTVRAQRHKI